MKIPELSIERTTDGLIELQQQNGLDEPDRIEIHPLHLRHMAESLGLAREMSASEADALRTVDKLARRLRVLSNRIEQLNTWIWEDSEDMSPAVLWHCDATRDLSREFMKEIEEWGSVVAPKRGIGEGSRGVENPPSVQPPTPEKASNQPCVNTSGKASAKASEPGAASLFGGDHG